LAHQRFHISLRSFRRHRLLRTPAGDVTGKTVIDLTLIAAGCLCIALAVDVFFNPNDVVPGGFTAVAMFANRLWGWPVGVTLLALNIPFLVWGMKVLGVQFGPKTVLAAGLSALLIDALQPYLPVVRGEPLLYTLYGGLLYGLGMALVFRADATTGGTEIPAKLLERYRGIRLSTSLLVMDMAALALAALFFGLAPALYALIAAWVMARVIDAVEAGLDAGNTALIVTGQPEAIRDAVMDRLDRGVTILRGEGGYTGEKRTVLFVAVNRRQVHALREIVSEADPEAFMVISPSHEVLGEGFKPLTRTRARKST
jgi:uncharacterized membrane-anchored protein YitT (DUF2179 family)